MTLTGMGIDQVGSDAAELECDRGRWVYVCEMAALTPHRGVCALIDGEQIALFRLSTEEVAAVGNLDPFSNAQVISRGIIGDRDGVAKVSSPVYKQSFDLRTGECFDDPSVSIPVYPVHVDSHRIHVRVSR